MITKQASKPSGTEELPVTDHRKIEWDLGLVVSQPGRHVSGLYRAGCAVGALLDAGVW
jgi:hypothetical protein